MANATNSHLIQPGLEKTHRLITIQQLRTLFMDIFTGKLQFTQKIDGINIMFSFKNGKCIMARRKNQLNNSLELETFLNEYEKKGHNDIKQIYKEIANNLNNIFTNFPEIINYLQNNNIWIGMEIVTPQYGIIKYEYSHMMIYHTVYMNNKIYTRLHSEATEVFSLLEYICKTHSFYNEWKQLTIPILKMNNTSEVSDVLIDKICKKYSIQNDNLLGQVNFLIYSTHCSKLKIPMSDNIIISDYLVYGGRLRKSFYSTYKSELQFLKSISGEIEWRHFNTAIGEEILQYLNENENDFIKGDDTDWQLKLESAFENKSIWNEWVGTEDKGGICGEGIVFLWNDKMWKISGKYLAVLKSKK